MCEDPFCQYCEIDKFETIDHVLFFCDKSKYTNSNKQILEDIYNFKQLCEIYIDIIRNIYTLCFSAQLSTKKAYYYLKIKQKIVEYVN